MDDLTPQQIVDRWNTIYPVGSPVALWSDDKRTIRAETLTASPAELLSGKPVIELVGRSGLYNLANLKALPPRRKEELEKWTQSTMTRKRWIEFGRTHHIIRVWEHNDQFVFADYSHCELIKFSAEEMVEIANLARLAVRMFMIVPGTFRSYDEKEIKILLKEEEAP